MFVFYCKIVNFNFFFSVLVETYSFCFFFFFFFFFFVAHIQHTYFQCNVPFEGLGIERSAWNFSTIEVFCVRVGVVASAGAVSFPASPN